MDIEIFEVKDDNGTGFGYRVGGVFQEYDPEQEGFHLMTRERAQEMAEATLQRLQPASPDL